jgi:hypothetical protein
VTADAPSLVDAYEQLRAVALGAQSICGPGLSTLRRQGMVAWIRTASMTPDPMPRPYRRLPPAAPIATSELTSILASLVATLASEPAHA